MSVLMQYPFCHFIQFYCHSLETWTEWFDTLVCSGLEKWIDIVGKGVIFQTKIVKIQTANEHIVIINGFL
jgi:hypothetical protein